MGKGQRHSKNAGVMGSEGLTYHEKRALGFGTVRERVGRESQGNYYDCNLTLQPAVDPVCTPHGYLFSKEAILQNLLDQRKANKRKLAAWEARQEELQREQEEIRQIEEDAALLAFQHENHLGDTHVLAKRAQEEFKERVKRSKEESGTVKSVVNIDQNRERIRENKSFWHPSTAPMAKAEMKRPSMDTFCPASGKKLRMKDLISVKFTPMPDGLKDRLKESKGGAQALYMDPVSREILINSSRLVVLLPMGIVMTKQSYQKCVKPEGEYEGKRVRDVIELKSGGTGFAARDGSKAEARKYFALGPGSGLTDLRGQTQGPRSHGGLQFWN